ETGLKKFCTSRITGFSTFAKRAGKKSLLTPNVKMGRSVDSLRLSQGHCTPRQAGVAAAQERRTEPWLHVFTRYLTSTRPAITFMGQEFVGKPSLTGPGMLSISMKATGTKALDITLFVTTPSRSVARSRASGV